MPTPARREISAIDASAPSANASRAADEDLVAVAFRVGASSGRHVSGHPIRYRMWTVCPFLKEPQMVRFGIMTAPAAGRLRRHPAGVARGGRHPRDRARLAVRPPAADRRRSPRADLRGLDAAVGARRPDASGCASACSSPATASGHRRCWPRSPRPSTSSPAATRLRHRRRLAPRRPDRAARVRGARPAVPRLRPRRRAASPRRARSSGGCGPRTCRSTSTAPTSS